MIERAVDFIADLTWLQVLSYFWPFFLLDMVRYVLLEIIVLSVYIPKRWLRRGRYMRAQVRLHRERPLVSVLVPGKNEGQHIPRLVETLSRQTYNHLELIVVDDGSDDDTAVICRALEKQGKISRFIRNEIRGGKASAANTALYFARGKYVVHIDADSHLSESSIETILLPMLMDESVGAVGGDIRVANIGASFATRLQALEYYKSISTGRTTTSELGILRIISGAYGAFRMDVLRRLKGWDVGPGLDGDITLKFRKLGFKVVHEPMTACYTNVPVLFRKLARQRYRWDKSMIRFRVRKHRDILLPSRSFRAANFIASLENIFFNLVLDIKWWVYILQIVIVTPEHLELIFLINYFLYLTANYIEFATTCMLLRGSLRRSDYALVLFIPLLPLYTGIYLRIVRTFSYLMELVHKTSYVDRWNPWKVSQVAKHEKL